MKKYWLVLGMILLCVMMGSITTFAAVLKVNLDVATYKDAALEDKNLANGVAISCEGIKVDGWIASDKVPNAVRIDIYKTGDDDMGIANGVYAAHDTNLSHSPADKNQILNATPGAGHAARFSAAFSLNDWFMNYSAFNFNSTYTIIVRGFADSSAQVGQLARYDNVKFVRTSVYTFSAEDHSATYNGSPREYATSKITNSSNAKTYSIYYYSDADCTDKISTPTNVGTYYVSIKNTANNCYTSKTRIGIKLTITKKNLTIKAKNQTITYGDSILTGEDAVSYVTVSGLAADDALFSITLTMSRTTAGTGKITPSDASIKEGSSARTKNYEISYTTGTLTIEKKEVTPILTAEDRLYNGTIKANGTLELQEIVTGDDVSATYTECTFNSPLVGTRTATATGIALAGTAASNYTLAEASATDDANITKAVLTAYVDSDLVNTAQEDLIKEKTTQAGTAKNITLPATYTIGNANGSYGSLSNESYTRSGVYYNALGVIEDTMVSDIIIESIPCVAVTYHITTRQNAVYGDNTTDKNEQTAITTYVNSTDSWQTENKARKIATNSPATATINVYLKEGEHLLVDTAIGVYYGRMDVTVTRVGESASLAEDKIDTFFPANYTDDFRVSKLNEAERLEQKTDRGDYWKEVKPFTAPATGVYTVTITVTGKSYLHSLDDRYTQNMPAQKPVTELHKFTINGMEQYGIDA